MSEEKKQIEQNNQDDKPKETPKKKKAIKKKRGINHSIVSGILEKSKLKKSGSMEIYLNTDETRKDTPLKGAGIPSFFTSTLFMRIPSPVVERLGKDFFITGNSYTVTGRLTGVRRMADGHSYDIIEFRAVDIIEN